jgi:hypothetical protein
MGPFNNETGLFEQVDGYDRGHWYAKPVADARRWLFYIAPACNESIDGADDRTRNALNVIYREQAFKDVNPHKVANRLGLIVIDDSFKRFDPEIGYYRA